MEHLSSMVELLDLRASQQPDDQSYIFLSDRGVVEGSLTFADLHRRASSVALRLAAGSRPGDRALLVFPTGIDFVVAFFWLPDGRRYCSADDDSTPAGFA
jgi:acyl-CoA synthetase (AMP-forming)/AMP-acid ligase II